MTVGGAQGGRPRSEAARLAVLHAVDDLVVELGYGAVTLKGIADRAGVSRQTLYRWWSTKAEILLEASAADARDELTVAAHDDPVDDFAAYLQALAAFLTRSPAGIAYRALLGEAQHDPEVARLLRGTDPLGDSAQVVLARSLPGAAPSAADTAALVGPVLFEVLAGRDPAHVDTRALARRFLDGALAAAARPRHP